MISYMQTIKPFTIAKNMTQDEWMDAIQEWPKFTISSNSKLKKTQIYQWTLPALKASVIKNGQIKIKNVCPGAGVCAQACYAMMGAYIFQNSMVKHTRNLQAYLNDPNRLAGQLIHEIAGKLKLTAFRIHDSGDYFSAEYARWWFKIVRHLPHIQFYSYTKMVKMFKETLENEIPDNLTLIYSYGGKQDYLINEEKDRHSKVFKSMEDLIESGYHPTVESDENATNPTLKKIGLVYHGKVSVDKVIGGGKVMGEAA